MVAGELLSASFQPDAGSKNKPNDSIEVRMARELFKSVAKQQRSLCQVMASSGENGRRVSKRAIEVFC